MKHIVVRRRIALLAVLLALPVLPALGAAASRTSGVLRSGGVVRWSGGPLNGLTTEANTCTRIGSCEDFSLDVETTGGTPTKRVLVTIEIDSKEPLTLTLLPPGGGAETSHATSRVALLAPGRGVWRVRAECSSTPCSGATYHGVARATWLHTRADGGGGPAISHYASGRPAASATSLSMHLSRTQKWAGEPTLGVNKRGQIIAMTAPPVRSEDGGKSWQTTTLENTAAAYVDPYLYLDRSTGRVFAANELTDCSQLEISDDMGRSWTPSAAGCNALNTDHETMYSGPPVTSPTVGYPTIVYYCSIAGGTTSYAGTMSLCDKSLDGGMTWVPTGAPAYSDGDTSQPGEAGAPGHCGGQTGHLFVDRHGTLYLPRGWCTQPYLAISHDEGLTWTRVQVAKNGMNGDLETDLNNVTIPDHEAGVGVDARGNIYYTWVAHDRLPYLAISRDHGRTFGKPMMVGYPGLREADIPSLDVTPDGKVLIGYMGSLDSPGSPWTGDYSKTTFDGFMTETFNPLSANPIFHSAPVSDLRIPLVRGACGPGRCAAEVDFIQVTFGPDGTGWGVFVDGCPDLCEGALPQGPEGIVAHLS